MDEQSFSEPESQVIEENQVSTSYLLWLAGVLQLHGLHRIYNGKIVTGLLWLFTLGLFGVGQLIDLFLIPKMVDKYNANLKSKMGVFDNGVPLAPTVVISEVIRPTREQLMTKLVNAAATRGGKLSVTQAVIATGASFSEVETVLRNMLKNGYVGIDNDPDSGIVIYKFLEL